MRIALPLDGSQHGVEQRWGFYETPVRQLVRAGGALVLAIAFAIIPFVALGPTLWSSARSGGQSSR
jgi:hypothetical protein